MLKLAFFVLCDPKTWRMSLKTDRTPLLCYVKLCTSSRSHLWVQIGVTVRKRPIRVKTGDFSFLVSLKCDGWTWKNNGARLLCHMKLFASFHRHMWIQTGVMVRKLPNWVLTYVTLAFDLWPWSFARTSLLSMVITTGIWQQWERLIFKI